MQKKRITLFAGHYGSGKTNVALNYARWLKVSGEKVRVADLDIVNPYFRTKDSAKALSDEGIDLIVSEYANSNVDFPALPKEMYSAVADRSAMVVMDIGGDDRGALALGRYVDEIKSENNYEMLAVINAARPLTNDVVSTVEVLREIEHASKLPFTGVVNNTNLGPETRAIDIIESVAYARSVAAQMGLDIKFTSVEASLIPELEGKVENLFGITIQRLYYHLNG
jgi:signal recognition particle GTPase